MHRRLNMEDMCIKMLCVCFIAAGAGKSYNRLGGNSYALNRWISQQELNSQSQTVPGDAGGRSLVYGCDSPSLATLGYSSFLGGFRPWKLAHSTVITRKITQSKLNSQQYTVVLEETLLTGIYVVVSVAGKTIYSFVMCGCSPVSSTEQNTAQRISQKVCNFHQCKRTMDDKRQIYVPG